MSTTRSSLPRPRGRGLVPRLAIVATLAAGTALVLTAGQTASAQPAPSAVQLGTAADYSVLASLSVSNTGFSVLAQSVGLSPNTMSSITGFPPGIVLPPGTIAAANNDTLVARGDLLTAYNDAAGRITTATVSADLGGQTLVGGVYAGGALGLTGQLTLDGQNDPNAVFVFKAASTLTTASASSVLLINGANPCNVFWQIGSSATLGTNSDFIGTILASESITLTTGADVEGRALAHNGSVTLDDNTFTQPDCLSTIPTTTTASPSTTPASPTTTPVPTTPSAATTVAAGVTTPTPIGTVPSSADRDATTTSFVFTPTDITLPATGTGSLVTQSGAAFAVLLFGLMALVAARRRQPA